MASFQDSACSICIARNIQSDAVDWCPECEEAFCNNCLEHHNISKATKSHKTTSIGDYKALPSFILAIKPSCGEHDDKYQHYCINHDVPLCPKCITTSHKECKEVKTLDEVIKNAKSSVAMENTEKGLEIILKNLQAIVEEKSGNLENIKEQRKDIERKLRRILTQHLEKLEENILRKLSTEADKNEKRLDSLIRDIKSKETQTRQLYQDVRKIIDFASNLQTFIGRKELENQVYQKVQFLEDIHSSSILNVLALRWQPEKLTEILDEVILPLINISTDENHTKVALLRQEINQAQIVKPNTERMLNQGKDTLESRDTYRALYDYDAQCEDELAFKEDDIFIILNNENPGWWFARRIDFGMQTFFEGLIPNNYVKQEDSLYSYEWYFGSISKKEAEQRLLNERNSVGAYMVTCDDERKVYQLSVVHQEENTRKVMHYEITKREDGKFDIGYSNTNRQFASLPDVISYFLSSADELCQKLTKPSQRSIENWEIASDTLEFGNQMPTNGQISVWKGKWNKAVHVAISKYPTGTEAAFSSELDILKRCRHDHIVQLYGVCSVNVQRCIITQLAARGKLLDYLRSTEGKKCKLQELVQLAAQVADALAYLESKNIIHRDVAARNVFLTEKLVVKLGDFKFGKIVQDGSYFASKGENFAFRWSAIEAIIESTFTTKSDVWSYGILLVEILNCGKIPYEGLKNLEVTEQIQKGFRHPKPPKCPESMYQIMLKCWDEVPSKRPTFEYLFFTMDDYFVSVEPYYEEVDLEDSVVQ